jgi:NAD(P)-dependent dehydrogenase (short-subunit alcohol dehydrogenase family)
VSVEALEKKLSLSGKRVLVTGGAKRIGRAIALSLAEAGAEIVITYRDSEAEAKKTVADVEAFGVKATAILCNVRDEASVKNSVAEAVAYLGGLDILVNNAGSFETIALEDITVEAWDAIFETNTRGPFLVARAALPHLRASKGRIINLGSLGGLNPWTTHGHYCASKAALHMLSQTMAKAWAPEVAVNCVAPGMIVLGETNSFFDHFIKKTPMNRNGTGEDCAEAVMFFATATSFITGQLIAVDGGLGLASRGEGSGNQ